VNYDLYIIPDGVRQKQEFRKNAEHKPFSGDYPLEIHVDERFVSEVEKFLQSSELLSKNLKSVQIVKDNRIGFGVLIDSEEGRVDARVETLSRNLKTLVESSLHDNPEDQLYKG